MASDFFELMQRIKAFRDERNWKQFHTPRNLAAAIAIESGELQEVLLWKKDDEVRDLLSLPEATLFCHFFNRERCGFQKVLRSPHPQHCYPAKWAHSSGLREAAG